MSSKTQKSSDEKIASAPRTTQNVIILVLLAILVLVVSALVFSYFPSKSVKLNGQSITVDVVDTPAEREQGLSGRESLAKNQGMLFVFSEPSQYCLWMKDMNFAIDMVWFDESKQVIHIQENATPESYPESFCPSQDAKYILEVPSGSVKNWGVNKGNQAAF